MHGVQDVHGKEECDDTDDKGGDGGCVLVGMWRHNYGEKKLLLTGVEGREGLN